MTSTGKSNLSETDTILQSGLSKVKDLIKLIKTLRGEDGCPWDKAQTPSTLSVYLVEELYELVDAIKFGSPEEVCEELGDVLFHILFICDMFSESGAFNIEKVASVNIDKMVGRHPHVFGDANVDDIEQIKKRWHEIKRKEKNHSDKESILDSIPLALPALSRAYRISERAAKVGFDWENTSGVKEKVEEEWSELHTAVAQKDQKNVSMEFGDLLFSLVNFARFVKIHPETALIDSIKKFETRFKYMEKKLADIGESMEDLTMKEMDILWEEAKKSEY